MNEIDIFADLVDHNEELLAFLAGLRELVPACEFRLYTRDGVLPSAPFPGPEVNEKELFAATGRDSGPVAIAGSGEPLYAISVPQLMAVLVLRPASSGDPTADPALAALIRNSIALTLLQKEQADLALENQQILRQIDVLNKQHHKLVEDNYRQYCLIQEREKEYARKLETEIARQTAELREANARLEEASRLKSEFLANMSHELRTPLNAIIGFGELLAETELRGEQEEYATTIRSAAHSLLALINDILDLAKIEAGKVELESQPFAIAEVVATTGNLFRIPAQEKGVSFTVDCDGRLTAPVLGDSNRLKQVLINLLGNALKFTDQGRIELRAEQVSPGEDDVVVRFSVRDSGIGIPPERQQAVFEKFTQADGSTTRRYGGTGLGLAICRQLVELMRGEMSLTSAQGQGSTFSFTLPLALSPAASPTAQPVGTEPPSPTEDGREAVVLLVEDNPVNQRLASIMLRKQGYQLLMAADGVEALDVLREHDCDLILMDFQMPRLDGLAATRKIRELEASPARGEYAALREKTGPIPVIGLTAHARRQDEQASYEAGMDGFLTKPIVRDKLAAVLRQHLS